jgi:hypothetical protein
MPQLRNYQIILHTHTNIYIYKFLVLPGCFNSHLKDAITADVYIVRFEVLTAVTMKNAVFWDIKTQFVLHRRHITSPIQTPAG